jgi:hypothetical protein
MSFHRLLLGLAFVASAFVPGAAGATMLAPLTIEQLTDASDYIVRGVVSTTWVEARSDGQLWTKVQIEVSDVYKGPSNLDSLELDVMGGILGDRSTVVEGVPRFDDDEEVLVFAEKLSSGLLVPTGLRQGKYTVRIDPDDGRPMLVDFAPPPSLRYDHRFIPDPPAAARVHLEDMAARITARVASGWDGKPIPGKSAQRLHAMYPTVSTSIEGGSR